MKRRGKKHRVEKQIKCPTGKVSFFTFNAAKHAAKRMKDHGEWEMHGYLCPQCKTFHIGHTDPKRK